MGSKGFPTLRRWHKTETRFHVREGLTTKGWERLSRTCFHEEAPLPVKRLSVRDGLEPATAKARLIHITQAWVSRNPVCLFDKRGSEERSNHQARIDSSASNVQTQNCQAPCMYTRGSTMRAGTGVCNTTCNQPTKKDSNRCHSVRVRHLRLAVGI